MTERSWWPQVVYLTGMGITLIILLVQTIALAIRLRRLPTVRRDGVRLALLDDDTSPCSFFDYIIIGTRAMSDEELQCVLAHESEHVRRHHTEDVLLVRLLCCVAWFNPFAWLMLSELRAVHEYQADAVVNAQRSTLKTYLCLLYRQVTGTGYGHITNNFQSINIKKRIVMMNKTKTRFGAWKVLAALPVAALLLMVGCKPATPTDTPEEDSVVAAEQVDDSMTLWDSVEVDPEFPDGMEGLYKYLSENIHYPEQAKTDGIEGRVIVNFVIEADGSVSNAKVLRGIGGGCDEEALRVVEAMPKWTPGKMQDKPVRVQFYLPVVFKLGA